MASRQLRDSVWARPAKARAGQHERPLRPHTYSISVMNP
jgi:hypothetical protein